MALGLPPVPSSAGVPEPRADSVFIGDAPVQVAPPRTRCRLTVRTTLPEGTKVRLQYEGRGFIMPWDSVSHPDTWAWRTLSSVKVVGGKVSKVVRVTADGYWRFSTDAGSSDPWFIDVYPTSDISDPGVPGLDNSCREP